MADIKNFTLNFGPQHPAAHGVLRLVLELDGVPNVMALVQEPPRQLHHPIHSPERRTHSPPP